MTFNALSIKVKDSDKTLAEKLGIEMPVPEKLEVKEVRADNLKEIKVVFNKAVDVESATNADNYEAPKDIKDITYLADENTAVLLLEEAMTNKKEYELVIKGVKDDKNTLDVAKKFTAVDNAIPEVVEVVGLGTKAAKIVVSEPIKEDVAKQTKNYRLDGKAYYGGVEVVGREIILRPYNTLSVGEHEISVKGLEDFAGLKAIESLDKFEVIEDKEAPEVVDVTGTLERVVVTFSEEIDPNSVKTSNIYWKNGTSKKTPRAFTRIAGNKYAFDFTNNSLPVYETTLYIENFADYSANTMKDVERAFKATIDESRPEVLKAELDDAKNILVKFNKPVNGEDKKYYKLVNDSDGKTVPVKEVKGENNDKLFTITLYDDLDATETYTLSISGIQDKTIMKNTMYPYETKLEVEDYVSPKFLSVSGDKENRTLYVVFSKKMDMATIANPANYLIRGKGVTSSATSLSNISGAEITVVQDGKAVIIELPKELKKNVKTVIGDNVYEVAVLGVEDVAGNTLKNYGEFVKVSLDKASVAMVEGSTQYNVVAKDIETVEIKFTQPILEVNSGAFVVTGATVDQVKGVGTDKITLVIDEDDALDADASNKLLIDADKVVTATKEKLETVAQYDLIDEIKPSIDEVSAELSGDVVLKVIFDEPIDNDDNLKLDFEVLRVVDNYTFKQTELSQLLQILMVTY
ncbi:MAG: hypothetical protein ACFWUA_03690 [Sporanaerobacter sp.]|uniref:Ig-like domain-containing protein n=1 Tax=Sporanaerobacter sp. TaxID=2010183 RepID=UPI003A0FF64D